MDIGKYLLNDYEDGYRQGLEKAMAIIEKEMEFARQVNPQMAMGMSQVKMLIKQEIEA